MGWKFNPFTSKQDYYQTAPVLPAITIDFDTADPNTPGTIFTPDDQLNTDALYVSDVNNSQWTSDGISYQTFTPPTTSSTEWYLNGTTIDAGSNKTASIYRWGGISAATYSTRRYSGNTGASNNNKWWKILEYSVGANYTGDSFKLQMNEYNDATGVGKSVIFDVILKRQDLNVYLTINVDSNVSSFDLANFDVLYNSTTQKLTFYYKITTTYTTTNWLVLNSRATTTNEMAWYGTLIGTSLSGQTSNPFTTKSIALNKVNGVFTLPTIAPEIGQVLGYGVGGATEWVSVASEQTNVVLFADLATTEALNACTYYNGIANDGVGATLTGNVNGQLATISNPTKIDNVVTALNQIILVWTQANQRHNGVYKVTQLGSVSLPFILTRTEDADQQDELYPIQVNVFFGVFYANRAFLQKTVDPIVGTSNIVFTGSQIGASTAQVLFLDTVTSAPLPTCTYASGTNLQIPGLNATLTADVNGAIGTINGVALVVNMRILIKDQVNAAHNGDYVVNSIGGVSSKWKLYRLSAWGGEFTKLVREWKVNNSGSTKFGARYSSNLAGLSNLNVGITSLIFNEVYALPAVAPTVGQVLGYSSPGTSGWITPSIGGVCGIANASGIYTYYTTLTLAMTAAVSGNTIELFSDITETGSVTITLKSGVNINGNGHTYKLSVNDTTNAFTLNTVGTFELYNLKVLRTGRTAGTATGYTFYSAETDADVKFFAVYLRNDFGTCYYGGGRIYNAHGVGYLDGLYGGDIAYPIVYDSYFESKSSGIGIYVPYTRIYNSVGVSVSGNGISCNGEVYECIGISTSAIGISAQRITRCTGISTSGTGLSGEARSCLGISTSGIGGTGTFYQSTLISSSNYGCQATLYNSYTHSVSSVATNSSSIYNSTVRCLWDNVGGHCTSTNALGPREILNSFLEVTNASAYCINGYGGSTWKYSNNSFKGSTTAVNATNITQGITNTSDNQGNILI